WLTATSSATASAVSSLMVGVVQGGTASNIAIPGITLGAKTGTAQTQVGAGSNNWLEAFGPAENPSIVVVATVPAQSGLPIDTTGSQIAGPIVKAMLEAAIQQGLLK
ncbi:MAG TPA: penicillin-binding transpeptidase domain-containing protein, partial [Acidimicrobiales bacterium]|nr:penicillin-binding transpeptidase domain-containing protein [Acidimicrobiales bacterium]